MNRVNYKLRDLLQIKNGKDHKDLGDGNIPVYGTGGVMRYADKSLYDEESILLPRKGTLSNIQYVNKPFWTVDTIYYTIINSEIANTFFLYNYLKTLDLSSLNSGTGVPSMTFDSYYNLEIYLPSLETQHQIALVLSSLDAKIELNNKINAQLEAMAKTLYDYWFVQFDFPNTKGKSYKSSGGKMVYNEELKREIPVGWEVKKMSDIESNIITGKTPPTDNQDYFNGNVPFITIGDIRGNMHIINTEIKLSDLGANHQVNKFIPEGAMCISCIASPGLIGFATQDSQTNQQINSIVFQKEENKALLYFALNDYFKFSKGAKTGNTFVNMNKGDFESITLINPPNEIKVSFQQRVESIFKTVLILSKENQHLSSLRDWLLPMLMNGQVKVGAKQYNTQPVSLSLAAEDKVGYGDK